MEEITGELRIVGYVDDIEVAVITAEKRKMPNELINDMNNIHDDIVELESFLCIQEHYDRLKASVEELIDDLLNKCHENDKNGAEETVKKLKDNVDSLKKHLAEDEEW